MNPPAWRNDESRKAARDEEAKRNAEAVREAQRLAEQARRRKAEQDDEDGGT